MRRASLNWLMKYLCSKTIIITKHVTYISCVFVLYICEGLVAQTYLGPRLTLTVTVSCDGMFE